MNISFEGKELKVICGIAIEATLKNTELLHSLGFSEFVFSLLKSVCIFTICSNGLDSFQS
jgi:hypothetical protein